MQLDSRIVMKELKKIVHVVCSVGFWRMAVLWTFSLLTSYVQLFVQSFFARKSNSFKRCVPSTTRIKRPVCIITGATSGLGAAAAYGLSREGFYVDFVGRSFHLLSKTMIDITSRHKDAGLKAFQVDLPSFWMMSTNYIGAFPMIRPLFPLLRNSPDPYRIVNATSFTHRNVFGAQVDNETVTGKCFLRLDVILVLISMSIPNAPENGINSVLDAALAPPETSGVYFFGGKGRTIKSSALSDNSKLAEEL